MIIIRTQNMENIVNCEDIIIENETIVNYSKSTCSRLGKYATQERAKEVMEDIWTAVSYGNKTYSMPKE